MRLVALWPPLLQIIRLNFRPHTVAMEQMKVVLTAINMCLASQLSGPLEWKRRRVFILWVSIEAEVCTNSAITDQVKEDVWMSGMVVKRITITGVWRLFRGFDLDGYGEQRKGVWHEQQQSIHISGRRYFIGFLYQPWNASLGKKTKARRSLSIRLLWKDCLTIIPDLQV